MNNFCLCNEYVIVIGFEWYKRTKGNRINRFPLAIVRKVRDSNPRYHVMGIPDFESSAFGHSANLPNMPCGNFVKQVQNYLLFIRREDDNR